MLAWAFGIWLGILGGIYLGSILFAGKAATRKYDELDITADPDKNKQFPMTTEGAGVPELRGMLDLAPKWVKWPDFEKTMWLNHTIKALWPYYNKIVAKMVLETAKPQIDAVIKPYPFIQGVDLEVLDLGVHPLVVGGVKTYPTPNEDLVIMEVPVAWGSNCRVRVTTKLKVLGYVIHIPLEVEDLVAAATVRVTMAPLVDTIPCLGAADVTLLEAPMVNAAIHMLGRFDLMILPGMREAVNLALKMVLNPMLIYPSHMSFPIMENSGLPPKPVGMLLVKVLRAEGLQGKELIGKIDPFVQMSIDPERVKRTSAQKNTTTPTWNDQLAFLVREPEKQALSLIVKDDDLGFNDKPIGMASIPLADAEFMQTPQQAVPVSVYLMKPESAGVMKIMGGLGKGAVKGAGAAGKGVKGGVKKVATLGRKGGDKTKDTDEDAAPGEAQRHPAADRGRVHLEIRFLPFKGSGDELKQESDPKDPKLKRSTTQSSTTQDDKGVLTVDLVKGSALSAEGENELDAFVELELQDPDKPDSELQRSSVIMNQDNPRWGEKFDFVMISATSTLVLTVYDKQGAFDNLLSIKTITGKRPDKKKLGTVRIDVADVARNNRMHDDWPLQETETGELSLKLAWLPVQVDEETASNPALGFKSHHNSPPGSQPESRKGPYTQGANMQPPGEERYSMI